MVARRVGLPLNQQAETLPGRILVSFGVNSMEILSVIDLRSDTVTVPCTAMRDAMANASVGDDVIDVDPTVRRLEQLTAEMLGTESAMFMPSGTMTNQVAVRIHCQPGHEFLCEEGCHIYNYEQGAFAQLSGVVARPIEGKSGILELTDVEGKIRADNEHLVQTRLLCLENTHNRAGGTIQPYETLRQVCAWAKDHHLRRHLDGARLFNAVMATGIDACLWASHFDTISVCFSKGLGAPVGSALAGPTELIQQARRHRKLFGGGMRQSGIIAAGALYALENNVTRLAEDHAKAKLLGECIQATEGISLNSPHVDTNIVAFRIENRRGAAPDFVKALEQHGVRMLPMNADCVRAVTHQDVSLEQVTEAATTVRRVAEHFVSSVTF